MEIIDLTNDYEFEEETASRRQLDRQKREWEPIVIDDSDDDESIPSVIPKTPTKAMVSATSTKSPKSPKSTPRNSNTKKISKSTGKKNTPSVHSGWRAGIDFVDLESPSTPLTEREKKRMKKEAEEKEIGDRIQKLAESVGWKQPHRNDDRKTRKNSTATPYLYKQERMMACDICGEKSFVFEITKLKCKHRHCSSCLQQNFLMVINDPSSWPAKCCKPLEQELALKWLSSDEFEKYLDVKKEKEQMSSTNCFKCRKPIPTVNIIGNSTAFCSECESVTCVHCAKAMHEGACLLDPETEKLLSMAQGKKWSKCPKCSNMVERNTGCNSMMCRCGMNFCYKCGREMRVCSSIRGECSQIAFQSGMWQNQAPHQPMQTDPKLIEAYRKRSKQEEAQLHDLRESMAHQNTEALAKQQVLSEIVALRAKLEHKPNKKSGNSPNSKKPSEPATPMEKRMASGMEGYRQKFPALIKAFEESKAHKTPSVKLPVVLDDTVKTPVPTSIASQFAPLRQELQAPILPFSTLEAVENRGLKDGDGISLWGPNPYFHFSNPLGNPSDFWNEDAPNFDPYN